MADSSEAAQSDRAEAFSDAIFAITITLLVLEIPRPPLDEPHLGRHLLDAWPEYAAFGVSFVYVGALWLNHHALFARIARVDLKLHWINLFILGTSALLPFSTAVLAGAFGTDAPTSNQEAAVALYAVVALLTSAAWIPVFPHLSRHPELLERPEDGDLIAAQHSRPWVGVASYAAAGILGWLISPIIALALFVWMIVYHAVTSEGLHANRIARSLTPPGRARDVIARRRPQ
ncbi:MAG: TMEM175 family protein [Solirubrobacteraceae bacterium]|nr:TMEM175 family protein [Solirubrobacteraceae bacterium]